VKGTVPVIEANVRKEAYYSNYGGLPECFIEKGDLALLPHPETKSSWKYGLADFHKDGKDWRVLFSSKSDFKIVQYLPTYTYNTNLDFTFAIFGGDLWLKFAGMWILRDYDHWVWLLAKEDYPEIEDYLRS
jgi:hypothetical protein